MEGKAAIVTGGASGLGEATALEFASRGAAVCIADIGDGEPVARRIRDGGGRAIALKVDVTSEADTVTMVEETVRAFGRLDFAYNNAGMVEERRVTAEIPVEEWNRVITLNLTGVWLCMRAEIPVMAEGGGGVIVNTASMAGRYGGAAWRMAAYGASKAGVISLSRIAARDHAPDNIRVVSVCPGAIETKMLKDTMDANPEWAEKVNATRPFGRPGQPHEVAKTVVWLCSTDASYISGNDIPIDGATYA
ncbi:MAG TPA: glucose 1-dehydrogenase [Acidimicrobiales bacterium]|nr:glucose 1-dehydrogenase [Acidimicrobiales bacterium]